MYALTAPRLIKPSGGPVPPSLSFRSADHFTFHVKCPEEPCNRRESRVQNIGVTWTCPPSLALSIEDITPFSSSTPYDVIGTASSSSEANVLCGALGSLDCSLAKPALRTDGSDWSALWPDVDFFVKRDLRESIVLWFTRVRRAGRQAAIRYVPGSTIDQTIKSTDDPGVIYVSKG